MSALEGATHDNASSELEDLLRRMKLLETEIKNKLDCDVFDNEISSLRELLGNLESEPLKSGTVTTSAPVARQSGPQISTKDMNRIKEILEKFPGVEELQQKILK